MLVSRLFEPPDDQLVYHYCSAQTLRAIFESRQIRFTDINMLNDAYETKWGYSAFEEAATRLIKRTGVPDSLPLIPIDFFDAVDEIVANIQLIAHPFVSCFSLDGDSLEQWRAYADDGRGFAIGFRASMLRRLPARALAVEYDRETQIVEMMTALTALFLRHEVDGHRESREFFEDCVFTAVCMIAFKHEAFQHEREIRYLHAVNVVRDDDRMRFVDPGGQLGTGEEAQGVPVRFHVRENHLCAYMDLPFCLPNGNHSIGEVDLLAFFGPLQSWAMAPSWQVVAVRSLNSAGVRLPRLECGLVSL